MTLPLWSSWKFTDNYLPPEFHSKAGFVRAKTLLLRHPTNKRSHLARVLGIGLAARDLVCQEEIETDDPPPGVPSHLIYSELKLPWVEQLFADSRPDESGGRSLRKRKAEPR